MRPPRVGIVSSVGGHLAEVLELEPVLSGCDLFLVLNDEAPWRTGLQAARSYRIIHAERDLRVFTNLAEAMRILWHERPDLLISTGASPAVPFFLVARCLGIETIFIETFGAVKKPSLTGRLVYPLAHHFFVQWPELLSVFSRARYAGPLFSPGHDAGPPPGPDPPVQLLISVGSSSRPFSRLWSWLDELDRARLLPDNTLVQGSGAGSLRGSGPGRLTTVPFLPAPKLEHYLRTAAVIICHGGAGILGTCLKLGRRPIVVPRRASHGEAINDHQLMLCRALSARGLITVCESRTELMAALKAEPQNSAAPVKELPQDLGPAIAALLRRAQRA